MRCGTSAGLAALLCGGLAAIAKANRELPSSFPMGSSSPRVRVHPDPSPANTVNRREMIKGLLNISKEESPQKEEVYGLSTRLSFPLIFLNYV